MSEKSKVKSFIRKGKLVKSFDRRKNKKKLILSSIVGVGLLGAGSLTLKKKLASNVSRNVSRVPVLPSNTIQRLPNSTVSQASVLSATTNVPLAQASTPNILSSMNVKQPSAPKVIRRKKTPVLNNQNPKSTVISSNVLEKRQPTKNPTQTMIKHQKEVDLDPEIPLLYQATAKMNNNIYFPEGGVQPSVTKLTKKQLQAENRRIKEMKVMSDATEVTSKKANKRTWGKKKKQQ